jgi:hypothetical protein
MGFCIVTTDGGHAQPWEHLAAKAGNYTVGQLLSVTDGLLTPLTADTATTPPYVSMSERTVAADGDILPVQRVVEGAVYETDLAAAAADAVPGGKLQIAAGGTQAKTGAGTFELVSLEGTDAGRRVRGRWA